MSAEAAGTAGAPPSGGAGGFFSSLLTISGQALWTCLILVCINHVWKNWSVKEAPVEPPPLRPAGGIKTPRKRPAGMGPAPSTPGTAEKHTKGNSSASAAKPEEAVQAQEAEPKEEEPTAVRPPHHSPLGPPTRQFLKAEPLRTAGSHMTSMPCSALQEEQRAEVEMVLARATKMQEELGDKNLSMDHLVSGWVAGRAASTRHGD